MGGNHLKITIQTDAAQTETEIFVRAPALTPELERILETLRLVDNQITVTKNGETYILDCAKIAYIESVDRRTFVYTEHDCYESRLKLYELDARLCGQSFQRISKSCIVHIRYIRTLRAELDRRLRITLENGEQLIASRQYADELKKRLGI